jgi:hypothetical protein
MRFILVDGKSFQIRVNLWNFLHTTQIKLISASQSLWIDAICIDQTDVLERNHQVGQMGLIFSGAVRIISWLGCNDRISLFLDFWEYVSHSEAREIISDWTGIEECWRDFATDAYWKRAWITQEILLATDLTLMTNATEIRPRDMRGAWWLPTFLTGLKPNIQWDVAETLGLKYLSILDKGSVPKQSLVRLIGDYPARASQIPRDQIYSLLSLAHEAYKIPVDYRMPDNEFFLRTLNGVRSSLCLCSLDCLANTILCGFVKEPRNFPEICIEHSENHRVKLDTLLEHETELEQESLGSPRVFVDRCSNCGDNVIARQGQLLCLRKLCFAMAGHLVVTEGNASDTVLELEGCGPGSSVMHMQTLRSTKRSPVAVVRHLNCLKSIGPMRQDIRLKLRATLDLVRAARRIHQIQRSSFREPTCPNAWNGRASLELKLSVQQFLQPQCHLYDLTINLAYSPSDPSPSFRTPIRIYSQTSPWVPDADYATLMSNI